MNVGIIGTGLMGLPMGMNIIKQFPLKVYNRTKDKSKDLIDSGAIFLESPYQVANEVDVLIVMVTDDEACESIFNDKNGILHTTNSDLLIVNMSTITPKKSRSLNQQCNTKGIQYSEAPVAGTVGPAIQGTLKIFFGGTSKVLDKVRTILDTMGDKIFHIGEVGQASEVKLLVNINLAVQTAILSETLAVAEIIGISAQIFLDVVNNTAISTIVSKFKGQNMIKGLFPTAFPFEHMVKDLRYGSTLGSEHLLPLTNSVKKIYEDGLSNLQGKDFSSIYEYYDKHSNN